MMEKLLEGSVILGMGLGTVLTFLVLLIISMIVMSKVIGYLNKVFPEAVEEVKSSAKKAATNVDEAIAVAIAAIMAKRS